MDCGEVRRLAGREVPDRQFQLDADPPRARTAQRGEEPPVDCGDKAFGRIWSLEHFALDYTIHRPTKGNT